MYSYRGYDAAMIFCRKMYEGIGRDIENELFMPLTTPYRFSYIDGVYVNTEWYYSTAWMKGRRSAVKSGGKGSPAGKKTGDAQR